ncbi:unnamed protein product, partial [Arctogadus glacialis]
MCVVFSHPHYAHGPIKEGYASQTLNQKHRGHGGRGSIVPHSDLIGVLVIRLTLTNDMSLSFFSPPPPPARRISSLGWRVKEVEEDYFKSWPPAKSLDQGADAARDPCQKVRCPPHKVCVSQDSVTAVCTRRKQPTPG